MSVEANAIVVARDGGAIADVGLFWRRWLLLGTLGFLAVVVGGIVVLQRVDPTGPPTIAPTLSVAQPAYHWVVTAKFSDPYFNQRYPRSLLCRETSSCLSGIRKPICIDDLRCLANANLDGLEGVVATSDGGSTWRRERLPDGLFTLGRFSCTSSGWCAAVAYGTVTGPSPGGVLLQTDDMGASWTTASISAIPAKIPSGIDCPEPGTCLVTAPLGTSILVTHDFGRSWVSSAPLPHFSPSSFSPIFCTNVRVCWAYGYSVAATGTPLAYLDRTDDGGVTWRSLVLPKRLNGPAALLCPDQGTCWMSGYHLAGRNAESVGSVKMFRSHDGGSTWTRVVVPNGLQMDATAMGCVDGNMCWDLAFPPSGPSWSTLLITKDRGTHWFTHRILPMPNTPYNLAVCPSEMRCLVGTMPFSPHTSIARLDPAISDAP